MTGQALAPLRASYGHWLALGTDEVVADRDEQPDQIRAMQILLRLEKANPPSWHAAAALAARGAAALCLDPRAEPDGEWYEPIRQYCQGHIRKVTRRGRGSQWLATADLPGLTLTSGPATEIRVLVPGLVTEVDPAVAKLQVGGTDVEVDEGAAVSAEALQIWVNPDHVMTLGKTMAQTGHAGMIAAALLAADDKAALTTWVDRGLPTGVQIPDREQWAAQLAALTDPPAAWTDERLLAVRDAGFTEVPPGTVTILARAPR